VNDAFWLVGEAHEARGSIFDPDDHDLHVFASDEGGASFGDVVRRQYLDASSTTKVMTQFRYPNGTSRSPSGATEPLSPAWSIRLPRQ
jgi:hypothetical protein